MTDNKVLEQELLALGQQFQQFPSVATKVMAAIELPEPPGAIQLEPNTNLRSPHGRRRLRVSRWLTVAATVLAASVGILISLPNANSIAFAQVQLRINNIATASLRRQQIVKVTFENGETQQTVVEQRILMRDVGLIRIESPGGRVTIINEPDFRMLEVDPAKQTAKLTYLYAFEQQRDVITALRALYQTTPNAKARPITPRMVNGRSCPGFGIEEQHASLQVWVDPATVLPVQAERTFRVLKEVPPAADGKPRQGQTQITEIYLDMTFDTLFAKHLFDAIPPAGFALTTVGTPPADRKQLFAEPLVLTPLKGVGPIHFGMSKAQVLQLLGQPDRVNVFRPTMQVSDDIQQIDDQPRPNNGQLVVLTEFHELMFRGLGLGLTTEVEAGVTGITCLGQEARGLVVQNFPGTTDKGIRLGSTEDEVLRAYGEPDKTSTAELLNYGKLGLAFQLNERRTVRTLLANDGVERHLRFEWRAKPDAPPRLEKKLQKL